MKIGILGGSFNPIHNGHIKLALSALSEYSLDNVLIMPNNDTYYKQDAAISDEDRIEMIRLAIRGIEGLELSDMEIRRGGITYTIDTIRELKASDASQGKENEYYFIIGGDSLEHLYYWREIGELFKNMVFLAAVRDDINHDKMEELRHMYVEHYPEARIEFLSVDAENISSSDIRRKASKGLSISDLVSPEVEEYIVGNKLYFIREGQ